MPDSRRLRIKKGLTEWLAGITPANGFTSDLGPSAKYPNGKVFRGRIKYGHNDPIPMISILEAPIPKDPLRVGQEYTLQAGQWELLIQGFVEDDPENPTDPADNFMAEVKQRLVQGRRIERGMNILNLGGYVAEMNIGGGAVRPADEASDKGFFWLTLTLRIVEDLNDPWQ